MKFLLLELARTWAKTTFGIENGFAVEEARIIVEAEGFLDKDLAIMAHAACDGDESSRPLPDLLGSQREGCRSFLTQ